MEFSDYNGIFNEYLDDDVHETEQFVSELNKQTGINPDTIVKVFESVIEAETFSQLYYFILNFLLF